MFNAEEEEDNPYLVDFQQKYIDKALRHHETDTPKNVEDTEKSPNVEDDEWYICMYNIDNRKSIYRMILFTIIVYK